jgi:SAM-dependent methyltransferase
MSADDHPWEKIYRKDGRVFLEPFPMFSEAVDLFTRHGCTEILDLGCGSGRHCVHLAKAGFNASGLDISLTGLGMTREWLRAEGLTNVIVQADFRQPLPFRDGSFSGVFSTQVIHHARIAAVRLAIGEIQRVLLSSGVAYISVAASRDEGECIEIEPGTIVPQTGSEAGLPHHIFSEEALRREFQGVTILNVFLRAEGRVRIITLKKP